MKKADYKDKDLIIGILLLLVLIYNIVSGLLPDKRLNISLVLQDIIAFSIGIASAFYTIYFLKKYFDYFFHGKLTYVEKLIQTLTKREIEIFFIIKNNPDLSPSEISKKLNISEKTYWVHMSNICKKLGVKNKKELFR